MTNTHGSPRLGIALISPAAAVILIVTGYPICHALWLSLHNATLTAPEETSFIGLANYRTILTDHYWWSALAVTSGITLVSVTIEFILGMALAIVMHYGPFLRNIIRTSVLVPYGIVTVVAAYSWYYAWTPSTGYLIKLFPLATAPLTHTFSSLSIIIVAEVWKTTPFMALLLLAGLALVPEDVIEAARMDGAGRLKQLTAIMIPIMKPTIGAALLLRSLDAFRIFDNIYILTNGQNGTESVSILGYDNLFKGFNLGLGSAISVLIFLCAAGLSGLIIALSAPKLGSSPGHD